MDFNENRFVLNIKKLNYNDLIIFLIPFLIFMFYLYVYNPGILSHDSFNQLHQIARGQFNNWHPFFHTFIEMLCLRVYPSPISVGILQILTFSTLWMVICKYNRSDERFDKQVIIQIIITLAISLIPINAIYSITLWKDVLFSYFLMFLCFLVEVMIDRNGKVDIKFVILFSLVMALVSQLRPNGFYVIAITLVVFCIYLFMKDRKSKMYIALPVFAIIFILLITSLNVAYEVEDSQKDPIYAKVIHMLADYQMNLDLDDGDRDKIYELTDKDKINKSYTPYYSDPIMWISHEQVYKDDKESYINMAIRYSLENPIHFIKYTLKSSAIVWDITRDDDWKGNPYNIGEDGANIGHARDKYFKFINDTPIESFEKVDGVNYGNGKFNFLNSFASQAKENIVLDTLFNSPALYMYLAIILLVLIQFITKTKDMYLVYLPNLINIVVVFVSIPVQDNRYLYPNLLVFYLLAIILLRIWSEKSGSQ